MINIIDRHKKKNSKDNYMKKILLTLIGFIAIAFSMNAETYTHTFKSGELTTTGGNVALSGISWTASSMNATAWRNGSGIQIGNKSDACENYSLSTSAFTDFTITSVTVYSSIASSGDSKLTIKVGQATSGQYSLTTTNTAYKFVCKEKGDIIISWNATQRAYYVSKIEVEYELPADMVNVETPVFKTPTDSIYADKVKVTAETNDQSLVLYYTIDGTDPSYEDFNSDPRVGTTKCSKYWVLYEDLTDSTTVNTIRAMAVKVDGESVYKSEIAEATYIVSPTKPYIKATTITNGNRYALAAGNDSIADALVPGKTNGYLNGRTTNRQNQTIEAVEYDAFTFTATNGGYTIQDATGRYMYINETSNEFSFSKDRPATGALWNITFNNGKTEIKNGSNTIYYVADEDKFGCYKTAGNNMELPSLYMLREYPQATFTPENGSEVKGLQEIIISCEEGISVSDDFSLRVVGNQDKNGKYEIDATYKYTQVDNNTLKFTIDTPLKSENNINIDLVITGDIYLNPDVMRYPLPIKGRYTRSICSYNHIGDAAPAVITEVSPGNNETVEELSYFVFTFSNYSGHSDDAALQPRLYAEGKTWTYALERTTDNGKGEMIEMKQLALKTTEPLLGNGIYFFEIPTGYFTDCNGNAVEGVTLKYIVKNDSGLSAGIGEIDADNNEWIVYDITGTKVLETTDANELKTLIKGIYIINGKKVLVR